MPCKKGKRTVSSMSESEYWCWSVASCEAVMARMGACGAGRERRIGSSAGSIVGAAGGLVGSSSFWEPNHCIRDLVLFVCYALVPVLGCKMLPGSLRCLHTSQFGGSNNNGSWLPLGGSRSTQVCFASLVVVVPGTCKDRLSEECALCVSASF